MKKICHITCTSQKHIPRLIKESKSALKIGLIPYIISPGNTYVENGINHIGIEPAKTRFERMTKTSKTMITKALEIDADIYQLHDPVLLLYALILKRKGKIVIFDSHEFYGMQIREKGYIPKMLRHFIAKIYMIFEAYINKRIDATIEVCTVLGKDYFEGRCNRRIFITNTPILDEFVPTSDLPFEQRKTIAHIGGLNYARGITHLIQGTAKTKATLILGGDFDPIGYREELQRMPEYSCVHYCGFLTQNQVREVLDKCLAGVATLLHIGQYHRIDTFATKVYEYMAMGLPVIISNTSYAVKVLEEYKFGIAVDPANPEEIAKAINYLLEHPQEAYQMGQNGRRAALKEFNWGVEEKKLLALYQELSTIGDI